MFCFLILHLTRIKLYIISQLTRYFNFSFFCQFGGSPRGASTISPTYAHRQFEMHLERNRNPNYRVNFVEIPRLKKGLQKPLSDKTVLISLITARFAVIARKKLCRQMPASIFMNVKAVKPF
jgi:hypothetical protein